MMVRACIRDHRHEHSFGNSEWLNGCAQCEAERLTDLAHRLRDELAREHADHAETVRDTLSIVAERRAEIDRLRADIGDIRMSLAAALGWPGGVGNEPPPLDDLLRMVADWRRRLTLASRVTSRADHT